MSSKSGVIFISFFVILALVSGIIGVILYCSHEIPKPFPPDGTSDHSCEISYSYEPISGKCLHLISDPVSGRKEFFSAICSQIQNGNVIQVLSDQDQDGLVNFMEGKGELDIWLDLALDPKNRLWVWPANNETAVYTNWSHEYKEKSPRNCAVAKFKHGYQWTDSPCSLQTKIFAVCEYYPIII